MITDHNVGETFHGPFLKGQTLGIPASGQPKGRKSCGHDTKTTLKGGANRSFPLVGTGPSAPFGIIGIQMESGKLQSAIRRIIHYRHQFPISEDCHMARDKGSSIPLGDLLAYFRNRARLTVRGLADLSQVSHTYLGAVERGDSRLTPSSLSRIAITLGLSPDDTERLRHAAIEPSDPLVAPGFVVGVDALMKREAADDVRGVWVMERQPIELDRPEWLDMVGQKLKSECQYVYLVRSRAVWKSLEAALSGTAGAALVRQLVICLEVPEMLQPFIFFPGSALYLTTGERNVLGVWAFLGPYSHRIDSGCVMERIAAEELYRVLTPVVDAATIGEPAILAGIQISVLHGPRNG